MEEVRRGWGLRRLGVFGVLAGGLAGGLATVLAMAPRLGAAQVAAAGGLGLFTGRSDIGVTQPGTTSFDPATKSYRVSGGGADIWGTADAFSYTWRPMSGDGSLAAEAVFTQPLAYPIAKGVLMFRGSLAPGAPYADIAIHGDGHITLQYRTVENGETKDVLLPEHGPVRLRVERKGDRFTAQAVLANGRLGEPASITVPMHDPVYVGLGVGSHNVKALQTVVFSGVTLDGAGTR